MRVIYFLLLTFFFCIELYSQVELSYGPYFQNQFIQKSYKRYDASDVFGSGDSFHRVALSGKFRSKHNIVAVFDFDFFWDFQNHQLTYRYWLKENIFVGLTHQSLTYYVDDDTFTDLTSSDYYGYIKSRQIGLTAGIKKDVSSFGFLISSQVLFGGSPESHTFKDLIETETNKRSLRTETFRIDNMLSAKLEGSVSWQIFHIKDFAFKFKYTGGIKHDWFAFENHSAFYEWTKSNALIDEKYKMRHTMIQFQNEIALVVSFN